MILLLWNIFIDLVNSMICYPTYCSLDHMFHFHKLLNRRDIRIHKTIKKKWISQLTFTFNYLLGDIRSFVLFGFKIAA